MLTISADRLGIWASTLCFIHCVLSPVILSLSIVSPHFLPSEERTHRVLSILIALIGAVALARGYRKHRRPKVLILMGVGLGCLMGTAWWGDRLATHMEEVLLTLTGSCFMIAAHRLNHTFCQQCPCSE